MTAFGDINTNTEINTIAGTHLGDFTGNDAIFPSTDPAGFTSRNENACVTFDDGSEVDDEKAIFEGVMSNDYVAGNDIIVDIDWVAETAITGDVVWGIEFELVGVGGGDIDISPFAAMVEASPTATDVTNGAAARSIITFLSSQVDAVLAGASYRIRITRVTTDVADDMVGDAQMLRIGLKQ